MYSYLYLYIDIKEKFNLDWKTRPRDNYKKENLPNSELCHPGGSQIKIKKNEMRIST